MHTYRDVAAVDWGICLDKATAAHNERFRIGEGHLTVADLDLSAWLME